MSEGVSETHIMANLLHSGNHEDVAEDDTHNDLNQFDVLENQGDVRLDQETFHQGAVDTATATHQITSSTDHRTRLSDGKGPITPSDFQ